MQTMMKQKTDENGSGQCRGGLEGTDGILQYFRKCKVKQNLYVNVSNKTDPAAPRDREVRIERRDLN